MDTSRRAAITALGTAGLTTAVGALAIGEYADDDRNRTGPGVAVADDDDADADADTLADGLGAVRIAHLSPATPTVDVTVDGEQLVAGVAFDELSPYLQFEPGTYTVRFTATDDPESVLFEDEVTIETAYYTIAVMGDLESDGVEPAVLVDAGAALVRFVHTSSDAPAIDVSARRGRLPLFENVAFGGATAYAPVPTGSYTLEVTTTGESTDESTSEEEGESNTADDSGSENDTADETDDAPANDSETDDAPANDSETDDAPADDSGTDDGTGDGGADDASDGVDPEDESSADADDTPADSDESTSSDEVDADDIPADVDEEDVPDDIDADDIPEDIDEEDIPDDIDADDIPDDLSGAEGSDNASRRVGDEMDVSLLSTDDADSIASIDVTLERGRAYTGYVVDTLESADRQGSDRDLSLTVTVDGDSEAAELADESGESY